MSVRLIKLNHRNLHRECECVVQQIAAQLRFLKHSCSIYKLRCSCGETMAYHPSSHGPVVFPSKVSRSILHDARVVASYISSVASAVILGTRIFFIFEASAKFLVRGRLSSLCGRVARSVGRANLHLEAHQLIPCGRRRLVFTEVRTAVRSLVGWRRLGQLNSKT